MVGVACPDNYHGILNPHSNLDGHLLRIELLQGTGWGAFIATNPAPTTKRGVNLCNLAEQRKRPFRQPPILGYPLSLSPVASRQKRKFI